MSSNALLWPSQGTIPERRLHKYKWLRLPSQGIGGSVSAESLLLAIFPPLADTDYQNYEFYQINKDEIPVPSGDVILEIIDSVGSGIFQEASGFDIRAFDSAGVSIDYEVVSVNVSTGDFTIKVTVPNATDLSFIQLTFGNPSATDGSTALGAGTTLSIHETPLLTKDEDNFLVDDMGRNIVAVQ